MEAVAAIYTGEVKGLAQKVDEFLRSNKMTKADLANQVNYSRTAISRYLAGKYDSDATELEERLEIFLKSNSMQDDEMQIGHKDVSVKMTRRKGFFETKDSSNVIGVCSSCQEDMGLGIVVGKSGYGKTYALKYYAKMPRVAYIECDDTMSSRDLVEAIERALGIPQNYGRNKRVAARSAHYNPYICTIRESTNPKVSVHANNPAFLYTQSHLHK